MRAVIQKQYAADQKMWRIVFTLETSFSFKHECFGTGLSSAVYINGEKTTLGSVYENFEKYFDQYPVNSRVNDLIEHYGLDFEEFTAFLEVSFHQFDSSVLAAEFLDTV